MSEIEHYEPYKRPGYGTKGRAAVYRVNYFELKKLPKKATSIKYAVEITKPFITATTGRASNTPREQTPLKLEIKRKVFRELERKKGKELFQNVSYFFDGNNTLYSDKNVNIKTNVFRSSVLLNDDHDAHGRPNEFLVQIFLLQDPLNLNELDTYIQGKTFSWDFFNMDSLKALNDLMHTTPASRYVQFKDLILDPNTRKSLGGGMELWAGFFESVRPGENALFVNVNRAHSVFYEKKDLVTFLREYLKLSDLPATFSREQRDRINSALAKLRVRPLHRPNVKNSQSIECISSKKAVEHTFPLSETGETTNVKEYFKKHYKIELKYPHVVEMQKKPEVWPLECCEIVPGQRVALKNLNGEQIAKNITFTTALPKTNMETILREGVGHMLNFANDQKLKDFEVGVDTQMAVVPGRIMNLPTITYHSSSREGPKLIPNNDGSWNLRGRKFIKSGVPLKYWFVICCVEERYLPRLDIENFIITLVNTCRGQGVTIDMGRPEIIYVNPRGDFKKTIQREYNNSREFLPNKPQMILFLLPPEAKSNNKRDKQMFPDNVYDRPLNQSLYRDIKFMTSTVLGLLSQCIVADKIHKGPSYCANVALKINLMLGGTNSILDVTEISELIKEPVMLLGADVTHPTSENNRNCPSICSVVASVDLHGSRFIDQHREQKRTKEDSKGVKKNVSEEKILEMQQIVKELLTEYKEINRCLPKKIVMYRDGVSESQYKMVLEYELKAIQTACREFKDKEEKTYDPPITFIVVGKRHHIRANAEDKKNTDRNGNCLPGTIIDRKIMHPYLFDFLLYSHSSLQGTSRPAHCIVLYDKNKFDTDTLQEFTYKLCFNYQRATRSVSIPSPVYYAHLSAKHARTHVYEGKLRRVHPTLAKEFPILLQSFAGDIDLKHLGGCADRRGSSGFKASLSLKELHASRYRYRIQV
ncbi:10123_t:CDS:2 [Ambispora gerdemannii]|uniref:10123_t:CDS:1 n=1 Tax=Ambispora gerdemannii TaxID=144530 RepID=A0A9N8ZFY7_9GLOM|nr:10123_t:CDS:2 [Ambispora gerdemannii]